MSRIGKKPIPVPSGVTVGVDAASRTVKVEGSKGKLSFTHRSEVTVAYDKDDNQLVCTIPEAMQQDRQMRAYWGTTRSRIANMVDGVTTGYQKKLEVVGVGWNAKPQGKTLQLNIGFCHPVNLTPPQSVEFAVEGQFITISGPDKQAVGQFAAEIRSKRPPEPYNGKGIKYIDEIILRKQGKAFGA